jgi:hypothetical protein
MSFKLFIYYCALLGGWAAFVCWALTEVIGLRRVSSVYAVAGLTGAALGMLVAAAVGWLDALLNSAGLERLRRVGLCALLGLLGGGVGGLIGQVLNTQLRIPLFVGWIVAGVLIGAALGVFDLCRAVAAREGVRTALKKIRNGIFGGFVGGFVGGLPFTFLIGNPTLPRTSLAIGLVILGMCIGLLIGLAEVILTEASLRIEEGNRSGRELLLTRDEITIGRAESCDPGCSATAASPRSTPASSCRATAMCSPTRPRPAKHW